MIPDEGNPGWLEVEIDAAPELNDALSAFFFDQGATGLVTEDFEDHTLKAYFPLLESPEDLRHRVSTYLSELLLIFPRLPRPVFRLEKVESRDWQENWRRFFRPVKVSPDLLVLPAWEDLSPHEEEMHVVRIDPGPAFGTGQHATTKMCLRAMASFEATKREALLDVGTGSGILAIYGAMLGFGEIVAIDVDPEAVRWAERNIALNGLEDAVTLSGTAIEAIDARFTLVCAHLILGELVRLMDDFSRLVKMGGHLVVSGILREQVAKIERVIPAGGFFRLRTLFEEEWACMVLRKGGE